MAKMTKAQKKVGKVMHEFKTGALHSGKKGPLVKSRKQAIAIALSEAGMSKPVKKAGGGPVAKPPKSPGQMGYPLPGSTTSPNPVKKAAGGEVSRPRPPGAMFGLKPRVRGYAKGGSVKKGCK